MKARRSWVRGGLGALVVFAVVLVATLAAMSLAPLVSDAPPMAVAIGVAWVLCFLALAAIAVLALSRWRPR